MTCIRHPARVRTCGAPVWVTVGGTKEELFWPFFLVGVGDELFKEESITLTPVGPPPGLGLAKEAGPCKCMVRSCVYLKYGYFIHRGFLHYIFVTR